MPSQAAIQTKDAAEGVIEKTILDIPQWVLDRGPERDCMAVACTRGKVRTIHAAYRGGTRTICGLKIKAIINTPDGKQLAYSRSLSIFMGRACGRCEMAWKNA